MQRRIIAVGHQKNVGKDEFVKFCIDIIRPELRRLRIVRRGFADKLYDFCHSVYSWGGFRDRLHYQIRPADKDIELPKLRRTPRQILIDISQNLKAYDDDIWLNANLLSDDYDILFITDLRFPNEFEACEKAGAKLIRITRPGLPIPADVADTALNGWEDRWHFHVSNDDSLKKLHAEAESFVKTHILEMK